MDQIKSTKSSTGPAQRFWFLLDSRFLSILAQLIFVGILVAVGVILAKNLSLSLQKQGMTLGYNFLRHPAGFQIYDRLIDFASSDSTLRAIIVGILNTLLISFLCIILSTIFGIITGVALLSSNFLIRKIATFYVELLRNVPLLLAILATYSVILFSLPRVQNAINIRDTIFISNRGFEFPRAVPTDSWPAYRLILLISAILIAALVIIYIKRKQGDSFIVSGVGILVFLLIAVLAWLPFSLSPFLLEFPVRTGQNYSGGVSLSPEFIALLFGLIIGSAPSIAETVRAGIESVSKGQIEAANALGLNDYKTFRLVIFPQAMRVIVPPMTSNYLGITKNSSLAAAIAYPELFGISGTIINQTGRAIEMMALVMVVYMTVSLLTSLFMNWYNQKVRLVER